MPCNIHYLITLLIFRRAAFDLFLIVSTIDLTWQLKDVKRIHSTNTGE